ncbi:MAG: carboxypeptidase regulatory-like domain-containing protein [Xanthomonadales bacterium]|nr:carboxypeptidase regulatory-like domain-containing protein [Xanthomonadales bacterium]MCB1640716.1 carboxypeptidase regulatory-like domain-containing protein [Xanthomonadales bacterium]
MSNNPAGAVSGKVTDTQAEPLPGATIKLSGVNNPAPTRMAVSDAGGRYHFPGVEPGGYEIVVQMEGFSTFTDRNVRVTIDHTTVVNAVLSPAHMG